MQFSYKARSSDGKPTEGLIDASSVDTAVASLQQRNFIVVSIVPVDQNTGILGKFFGESILNRVKQKDVVILSRQMATLFSAKVPVVESLKILVTETENKALKKHLAQILDDIQSGTTMSQAFGRHPEVFSKFYIAMLRSGEESGKLQEIFSYLADYLERNYDLSTKAKNALIYPAFVFGVFIVVIVLMLVYVIPPITTILEESGQSLPIYTRIIIAVSNGLRSFGLVIILLIAALVAYLYQYSKTDSGKLYFSRLILSVPIFGGLYKKIYLARMADNLHTLISGGITVVRALEVTSDVVGNEIYRAIMLDSMNAVKAGSMISDALSKYEDIPALLSQMIKIGEATGKLDYILGSIANFYIKDVDNLVDNIVSLIEPIMIITLGLGVGFLAIAILMPIYNLSSAF